MTNALIQRNLPTWKINDATKLKCFLECNRKYFYEYILGWRPETPNNHLVFGTAWHKAQEHILLNGYDVKNVMLAYEAMVTEYRKELGPETDEMFAPKTMENALIVLNAYAKHFEDDLKDWEPKYVEIAGKINLTDDLVLHFRMDSILKHRFKEKIKSIEHKTGSNTWNWELQWPLSLQNGTYTHVMNCLFHPDMVDGVTFRGSFFRKVKKGWEQLKSGVSLTVQPPYEFMEYPATKSKEQMQVWLWNTIAALDHLHFQFELLNDCKEEDPVLYSFPLNPTSCSDFFGCQYLDYCQAWDNPLRRCYEPPLGFKEDHWDPSAKEARYIFEIDGGDKDGL